MLVSVIYLCKNSHIRIGKYFGGEKISFYRVIRETIETNRNILKMKLTISSQGPCLAFSEKKMAPKCLTLYIFTYEKRKINMRLTKTRTGMKNEWN